MQPHYYRVRCFLLSWRRAAFGPNWSGFRRRAVLSLHDVEGLESTSQGGGRWYVEPVVEQLGVHLAEVDRHTKIAVNRVGQV